MTQGVPAITADVRLGQVLGQVALLPAAVRGAFGTMVYDLLSHHRSKVGKNAAAAFPGKRAAQQFVFSRTFRFTRDDGNTAHVAGVIGEGFAAAKTGYTFGPRALEQLEKGGAIGSREAMLIPLGRGLVLDRRTRGPAERAQLWRDLIAGRRGPELDVVPRPGKPPIIVQHVGGKRGRDVLFGILTRRRTQRPLLGYFRAFDQVAASDLPKFERALEVAGTVAGQQRLVEAVGAARRGWRAYWETYKAVIAAHPRQFSLARRAASEAARRSKGLIRNLDL